MANAKHTFAEDPVAFRIPWCHFVSPAQEEKGDGLAWLDANAPHSWESLDTAISLLSRAAGDRGRNAHTRRANVEVSSP